jgi:flagellar motor switch protein FliN
MSMSTSDPAWVARYVERIRAALPLAATEAFGGATEMGELVAGVLPLLVMDLGDGHHLHLEIEARAGRQESRSLMLIMRPDDGARLFGLEPVPDAALGDSETQLRVLGEFTEGAEALSNSLASALAAGGSLVSLRVSGASLEEADSSPVAATAPLGSGDAIAYAAELYQASDPVPIRFVIAAPADLAAAIGDGVAAPPSAPTPVAPRFAAEPSFAPPHPSPANAFSFAGRNIGEPQAPPMNISAHPVSFGQLDPAPAAGRGDRGVDLILDVALKVRVELGSTQMTVEEVLALGPGSVVELDRLAGEPVDIVINDRLIARGEVVVVEENFGVRVTEIINSRARAMV